MGRKPKTVGPTARGNPEAFKQVLTRMGVGGWRALRMLAIERDTTINALAIEAFNDLLRKYGKRQSVENRFWINEADFVWISVSPDPRCT